MFTHLHIPKIYWLIVPVLLVLVCSCSPLYVKNFKYEERVRAADFERANAFLDKSKFYKKNKNRLLLLLEKGKIAHMAGDYTLSNKYLNEADHIIEDNQINVAAEALSLFTNDEQRPYKAEDFESVAVHFYKALNYMALRQPNSALVEARRLNLRLQAIDDKYPDHKNKYDGDALAHILMGNIYESTGDYNNAFVAFRNAVNLFDRNGGDTYMGVNLPVQLEQDIMRTAYLSGFRSELEFYERKFGVTYNHVTSEGGSLVFFWESGLGPVKDEWSINFAIIADPNNQGRYLFYNADLGITFPFDFDRNSDDDPDNDFDFNDLQFLRVAFPRYVFRPDGYENAQLSNGRFTQTLSPVENIDYIARKSLQDRFLREAGRGLARLALKKISEISLRSDEKTETAGVILGVVNALTEKADTRHWQTLPAFISYTRVPLQKGDNQLQLRVRNSTGREELHEFTVRGTGGVKFQSYHSLEQLRNLSAQAYHESLVREPVQRRGLYFEQ